MTAYRIENPHQRCHDCGRMVPVGEWILERRQASGGDGVLYSGFGQHEVAVCRDRLLCQQAKQRSRVTDDLKQARDRVSEAREELGNAMKDLENAQASYDALR